MPGVRGNIVAYLKDSAGNQLNGLSKSADFDSEWIDIGAAAFFGFVLVITSDSGTTPTLDIDVECSLDGGTTIFDYPAAPDLESADGAESGIRGAGMADFAQITTTDTNTCKFFPVWFPNGAASGITPRVRLEFDLGGTNPVYTVTAYKVLKNPNTVI